MEQIKYIGIDKLKDDEINTVMALSEEHYTKLSRYLPNIAGMAVHIKLHSDSGPTDMRKDYEITVKAEAATRIFTASSQGWVLELVMKDVFSNLIREIEHMFHDK